MKNAYAIYLKHAAYTDLSTIKQTRKVSKDFKVCFDKLNQTQFWKFCFMSKESLTIFIKLAAYTSLGTRKPAN